MKLKVKSYLLNQCFVFYKLVAKLSDLADDTVG